MNELPKKDYYRPDEIAAYFCVSRATIYRWIDLGTIRTIDLPGRSQRIPREEIERLTAKED